MLSLLTLFSLKEGFSFSRPNWYCKKSSKCSLKKNNTGMRKEPNYSWLWYVLPFVLGVVLFFVLPRNEEYIAGILILFSIIILIIKSIFNWISKLSCPNCYSPPKMEPAVIPMAADQYIDEEIESEEMRNIDTKISALRCPNSKPFDPSAEPPDSFPEAKNTYTQCMNNGYGLEFCTSTPLDSPNEKTCLCPDGSNGIVDPTNRYSCNCD